MTSRVAVLVDGDNIPSSYSADISSVATGFGRIDVARVYADARRAPGWDSECAFRLVHAGCGKNASDILMVIDAMELAFGRAIDVFVVASSDRDFTHLVQRLREMGRIAIGVGEAKTLAGFRSNCTEFFELPSLRQPPPCDLPTSTKLDRKIRCVIDAHNPKGKGMALTSLSAKLYAEHGTRITTYPEKRWRAYLAARPKLYELDPPGPKAKVRIRPQGFGAAGA